MLGKLYENDQQAFERKCDMIRDLYEFLLSDSCNINEATKYFIKGFNGSQVKIILDKKQRAKRFQRSVEKYNKIYRVQLPKITPHVCRHTFCTNMAKRGISVETLKYIMGHTDISVTLNVYTHLKLEDAEKEIKRLENVEKELKKCAQ